MELNGHVKIIRKREEPKERIEGNRIILDGNGNFPKSVLIYESKQVREYRLVKTKNGGYLLTK